MPTPIFVGDYSSGRIYKIGRIGIDSGTSDAGGVFTAVLRTEKHSPAGEDGLCLFRRVYIRIHHTGSYTGTVKVFVDGTQTKKFPGPADQVVTITRAAPSSPPKETVEEVAISAHGTSIEVEISVDSDDITGIFLIEGINVGFFPIRESKERGAQS